MPASSVSIGRFLYAALLLPLLHGCSAMPTPTGDLTRSDDAAMKVLNAAAKAQGDLAEVTDVSVAYDGAWLSGLVNRVQPALVDERFRGTSEERLLLADQAGPVTAQLHRGEGGTKFVLRQGQTTTVTRNGKPDADQESLASASLVADAYRMFLIGPKFFVERGAIVKQAPKATIDGRSCNQFLAILKPGIGGDAEDRVLVAVDRADGRIRRYRMTLNALESTKGAVVDVLTSDYVRIAGVWWPTGFYEELVRPFPAAVHRWRLMGIDINRGMKSGMFDAARGFVDQATSPAGTPTTRPAGS